MQIKLADADEVLVVDDNPATRYATSRVLKAAGFAVREAGTGQEALERADAGVAAVVLDVHLPDIDGFEVCGALRQRPDTARVPVIYLSAAYVRTDDKLRGLHSGADAYMTHPAEPALLVATVQALVRARRAEDAMRRSEARFRAIYDQTITGICLIGMEGRIIEANPAMLDMLGRAMDEVVGRQLGDFAAPGAADVIAGHLRASLEGIWQGEFALLDARQQPVDLEWTLSTHNEPGVIMATAVNVSERKALGRQREDLLEREKAARATAERLSRAKDEFIAVLSHELRTPLNAIMSWVHVLKREGGAAHLPRGLDAIERNAWTQTRLISDILDMSRMGLGKLRLELDEVDAAELLRSACGALKSALADKNLSLSVDADGVRGTALLDAARVQQIVWNLLTNAIKFSPQGGRIQVRLTQEDAWLRLQVMDEGQGIKPEFLPHLFERFTQSDAASNRRHGGLGLGLSIVQHLVALHGGAVRAESPGEGLGATFTVMLPVSTSEQTPAHPGRDETWATDTRPASLGSDKLENLKVTLVEDDADAREMLSMILREEGAQVIEAGDYAEGLACLDRIRPDVLVSDIGLPGRDGYELIREVRAREKRDELPRLPAIALTAFARAQDKAMAMGAGFDAHCAKPLRPHELLAVIQELAGAPAAEPSGQR